MIKKRIAGLVRWHRLVGLLIAPVIILVVVTGILINHTDSFAWSKRPVFSSLVANLYGIPEPVFKVGFEANEYWFAHVGEQVYMDARPWMVCRETLHGVLHFQEMLATLCGQNFALWTEDGVLIEEIYPAPEGVNRLGHNGEQFVLGGVSQVFVLDENAAIWSLLEGVNTFQWSVSRDFDAKKQQTIKSPLPGITQERVLLDLHSGRLFGPLGVLIVDIAALFLVFLAFSGIFVWWNRRPRRKKL